MQKYIALLRGINVSGRNIIKMDELRKLFENLGFFNVKTYLQSGNVIFENKIENIKTLEHNISKIIYEKLGLEIKIKILTTKELENIIGNNPYKNMKDFLNFYVAVLIEKLDVNIIDIEKIKSKAVQGEEFTIKNNLVYINYPKGYGTSKLTNNYFENIFKVNVTTRNWKTMNVLLHL